MHCPQAQSKKLMREEGQLLIVAKQMHGTLLKGRGEGAFPLYSMGSNYFRKIIQRQTYYKIKHGSSAAVVVLKNQNKILSTDN